MGGAVVRETITSVLDGQLSPDEVDLVVLHQANIRIIDAAMGKLGIDREKVFVNLDRYGNTSGGSVPSASAERSGKAASNVAIISSSAVCLPAWRGAPPCCAWQRLCDCTAVARNPEASAP